MIKADRLLLSSDAPYENVEILNIKEQNSLGIKNYFEDAQQVFKCRDGIIVTPIYNITYICLRMNIKSLNSKFSRKVKRVTLSGELVQENAQILDPGASPEAGIPVIYPPQEQFVFACSEGLFITADYQVVQLEL